VARGLYPFSGAALLGSPGPIEGERTWRSLVLVSVHEAERHVLERGDSSSFAPLHVPKRGRRTQQ
jgi:hypothetical protein